MSCPIWPDSAWCPPSLKTGFGCGSSGRSNENTWTYPGDADGTIYTIRVPRTRREGGREAMHSTRGLKNYLKFTLTGIEKKLRFSRSNTHISVKQIWDNHYVFFPNNFHTFSVFSYCFHTVGRIRIKRLRIHYTCNNLMD